MSLFIRLGLSALFVVIISVGAVAAVLYQGYLAHCLAENPPAHLAALHGAGGDVLRHAGRGPSDGGFSFLFFWELMTVASFLLTSLRRPAARSQARGALLPDYDAHRLGAARHRLRTARRGCGAATFGALGDYFRTQPGTAAVAGVPGGLRHEGWTFPMRLASGGAPCSPVARLGPDVGRDDPRRASTAHPARRRARRTAPPAHRRSDPARGRHRHGTLGRDPQPCRTT